MKNQDVRILHIQDLSVINVINSYDTYRITLSTRGTISSGSTLMREEAHKVFMKNIFLIYIIDLTVCKRVPRDSPVCTHSRSSGSSGSWVTRLATGSLGSVSSTGSSGTGFSLWSEATMSQKSSLIL